MTSATGCLNSQVVIYPRGYSFTAHTPDKRPGMSWRGEYGFVGLDGLDAEVTLDGMNEKGLAVGGFYHPGFAEYQAYDPVKASESMGPGDVIAYLLSTCATVEDARAAIARASVVIDRPKPATRGRLKTVHCTSRPSRIGGAGRRAARRSCPTPGGARQRRADRRHWE